MKLHPLVFLLVATVTSCDRDHFAPPAKPPAVGSAERVGRDLGAQFSEEVLPESAKQYQHTPRSGDTPILIAHDSPPMDKEAIGPFSYLGAAREFQSICGFSPPKWVESVKGSYDVSLHSGEFVSQTHLECKIDSGRIDELTTLIAQAYLERWPDRPPLKWVFRQPDPSGLKYWTAYIWVKEGRMRLYDVTIGLDSSGKMRVFNTRGPDGWDR